MKEEVYSEKYYRVYATIDLDTISENIKAAKDTLKNGTKIMAIIKADGYGHGAVPIARELNDLVDAYGVAIVEEGIELRNSGIDKPILILGYTAVEQLNEVIAYDITQTVFQFEIAKQMDEEAKRQGKVAKVHIKIDTGMGRIGYQPCRESIDEIIKISKLEHIDIEGIFTHFACADMKDKTSADEQLATFVRFTTELAEAGVNIRLKHASNSAGIVDMNYANLDMVRCGITTYGLYPSEEVNKYNLAIKPAMELKTHISYVKELEAGHGIGYGSTFVTDKLMRIATIPVGYGDGYSRALSNRGRVLIHGKSAPIVGRVCMDQCMIDVSDIPEVAQGDVVTLIGRDGSEEITVEEIGCLSYSFNYEVVCNVGKRIPRIYYKNGKPFLVRKDC